MNWKQEAQKFRNEYSISDDDWDFLSSFTKQDAVHSVCEIGPGYSTLAFCDGGAKMIHCHETDDDHCFKLRSLGLNNWCLTGTWNPLRRISNQANFYDLGFVDGPHGNANKFSRLLPLIQALQVCEQVLLHDANREGEKRSLCVLSDMGYIIDYPVTTGCGIALIREP